MIIDFHTHIFPDRIASATIEALSKNASIPAHSNGTGDGLLAKMAEAGVDISINLPVVTRPAQIDSVNRFANQLNSTDFKGGRIISFAGIHPDIEDIEGTLDKIKEQGFLGIKLHPDYQGTFFDDEKYITILRHAKALDLITVTHAGLDGAFIGEPIKCTPLRTLRVLDRLGGYDRLVLAHMGGNELFDEVYRELAGENVYFDTAYVLRSMGQSVFEKILTRHPEDKILFATDSPWQDQGEQIEALRSYELGTELTDKLLCGNAKRLLKL